MPRVAITDFSGGLNTMAGQEQLSLNEMPDAQNFALTKRGALVVRNGCGAAVALPGSGITPADIFYSEALNLWLCACQSAGTYRLFTRPGDLSGSWTDRGAVASSTSARAVFADWPGTTPYALILTNVFSGATGGYYTLDNAFTLSQRVPTDSTCMTVWQNKVWISGSATNPARVSRSNVGDPTVVSDFTDLRENNASLVTGLRVAGGGLVAFKERSAYRINDSSTGAYTTIDPGVGCRGPRAVAGFRGHLYTWSSDGAYRWDGVGKGASISENKLPSTVFSSSSSDMSVGVYLDRVVYVDQLGAFYEYYPELGAWMLHDLGGSNVFYGGMASKGVDLYAPLDNAAGNIIRLFSSAAGLSDSTGTFTAYAKMKPVGLDTLTRLQRVRLYGSSGAAADTTKELRTYRNWSTSVTDTYDITSSLETSDNEEAVVLQSLGHADAHQLEFRSVGNTTGGAAQLDRVLLDLTILGNSY